MKKAIVIGVILLFLGVGFQPALANEISTTTVSDVDEDCFDCQPVNRVDTVRVKLLLTRLDVFINIILSKFGHIPEIVTICKEILDILKNGINDILCDILLPPLYKLGDYFSELLLESTWFSGLIIYGYICILLGSTILFISIVLDCNVWELGYNIG